MNIGESIRVSSIPFFLLYLIIAFLMDSFAGILFFSASIIVWVITVFFNQQLPKNKIQQIVLLLYFTSFITGPFFIFDALTGGALELTTKTDTTNFLLIVLPFSIVLYIFVFYCLSIYLCNGKKAFFKLNNDLFESEEKEGKKHLNSFMNKYKPKN